MGFKVGICGAGAPGMGPGLRKCSLWPAPPNVGPCAALPRAKLEVGDRTIQAAINATARAGFMIRFLLLQFPIRVHQGNRGKSGEVPAGLA